VPAVRTWLKLMMAAGVMAGLSTAALADPTQYKLESANGKTFVVKDHLGRPRTFTAKRTCQGFRSSHPVRFERGGPNVTCISAEIRDLVTNATCSVWCVRPKDSKLSIKPRAQDSRSRREAPTNLLELSRPKVGPERGDAGTRLRGR
jgi:hypothetical protein